MIVQIIYIHVYMHVCMVQAIFELLIPLSESAVFSYTRVIAMPG